MMDEIWAGNRVLEEMSRPHLRTGSRLRIVPTVIDVDRWAGESSKPSVRGPDAPLVLGWIGMPGNVVYLEHLRPVFDRLAERFPKAVLRIVSRRFFECARMPVETRTWTLENSRGDRRP